MFYRENSDNSSIQFCKRNFRNSVHTLVAIVLVLCRWSLQRRVTPKTANVWIWKAYLTLRYMTIVHLRLLNFPFKIVDSIILFINFFTESLILLQSRAVACQANQVNLRIQSGIWQLHLDSLWDRWSGKLLCRLEFH